ncbi:MULTISPECIES: ATP-binding cassette domain-containing protein [unclassified Parafrankia]|nr:MULTISPECIES: ATP-binding cassette domain-containing protein [unclassified Parafrankia]TCJ32350.1 ATP-binding cassette domain-containing protein [Parafrankia sp. BMG5.11]SQE00459.1 Daunorubicin/doxorubicin resistance ATP-binding protein DrrA [Parafrankia sp. Ea1.12]
MTTPAEQQATPTVRVRGLTRSYRHTTVLDGAGKTTMIRILATLLRPDAGTVHIAGYDALRAARQVRGAISLTGQYAAVDEVLTGEENLVMMGRLARLGRAGARARAAELLARFDLTDARTRAVRTYSGGMRRRLDLALGLVSRPQVVFLDEPTTGLDPRSRAELWTVIRELAVDGVSVLLTTQYLEEADRLADRVTVLDRGRVVAEGTPEELKSRFAGQRLELTFTDDAHFAAALRLLGPTAGERDARRRAVDVPTDGTATDVRAVLDRMRHAGLEVGPVALRRPNLDDVFLSLTTASRTTAPSTRPTPATVTPAGASTAGVAARGAGQPAPSRREEPAR